MNTTKVWFTAYIAGNPNMFTQIRMNGPFTRKVAIAQAKRTPSDWRAWVEHIDSKERIFENATEKAFKAKAS